MCNSSNAVAVYDRSGKKLTKLKGDCAAAVLHNIKEDKARSNQYMKPLFDDVVKKRHIHILNKYVPWLSSLQNNTSIDYCAI